MPFRRANSPASLPKRPKTSASGLVLEVRDARQTPKVSPDVGGPGLRSQSVVVPPGVEYGFQWVGSSHFLAFHDIRMRDGETFADDLPVKRLRDARGTFTFIPSGCRVWGWTAPTRNDNSFVAIYMDPRELGEEFGARMTDAVLHPEVFFRAPELLGTIGKLRRALSEGEQVDRLYTESLSVLAAMEFCRHRERRLECARATTANGNVPLARVDDYIRAHVGGAIALDDLAQVAGLSRFHFVRAFKECSGETPYQRVLRMRVERARELLEEQRLTITEIATAVGFKSASRFIGTFRRSLGMTPGQFATAIGSKVRRSTVTAATPLSRNKGQTG